MDLRELATDLGSILTDPRVTAVVAVAGVIMTAIGAYATWRSVKASERSKQPDSLIIEAVKTNDTPWSGWTYVRLRIANNHPATVEITRICAPKLSGAKITLYARLPRITKASYHRSYMTGESVRREETVLTQTPPHNIGNTVIDGLGMRIRTFVDRKAILDVVAAADSGGEVRLPKYLLVEYFRHDQRKNRRKIKIYI